jgi:hypothetical protein
VTAAVVLFKRRAAARAIFDRLLGRQSEELELAGDTVVRVAAFGDARRDRRRARRDHVGWSMIEG